MKRQHRDLPVTLQLLVSIALGLTPATAFFFFGVPGVTDSVVGLYRRADTFENRAGQLRADSDRCEAFKSHRSEYLEQTRELKERIETLQKIVPDMIPDTKVAGQFSRTISEVARKTGVHVASIETQPLVVRDFYIEARFSAKFDGAYFALENLFRGLERGQRIISVQIISLGPPEGRGPANFRLVPGATVRATCTLTTYFNRAALPPPARAR